MKLKPCFFISLGFLAFFAGCSSPALVPGTIYSFDLKSISLSDSTASLVNSDVFRAKVLEFRVSEGDNRLQISSASDSIAWTKAKYLVCDLYHENNYSAVVFIDFYKRSSQKDTAAIVQQGGQTTRSETESPRISPKIGILPGVKTRMVFPLEYLDGQEIFMDRYPRQLKGTVMGRRLDPAEIGKVVLRLEPVSSPSFLTRIDIAGIFLTDTVPAPLETLRNPVVDQFGQWAARDWKGKTKDEAEMKKNTLELESKASNAVFPSDWSRFGGWKETKFKATGFFRTENDGKRWWLVDPEGYAFLSAGVDCIRPRAEGMVSGQEDMFSWLPAKDDTVFSKAYGHRRDDRLMYDFVQSNLMRVYGNDWYEKWQSITSGLLKEWRVNTIANWSDNLFAKNAGIPYVINLAGFPSSSVLLYRDFPDVYSKEYKDNAVRFAAQLEPIKDDQFLIGYFLSNEPHWAFGDNNLAFEMFATTKPSETKQEFARWLKSRYRNDISLFNSAWNQQLTDFKDISGLLLKESPSKKCWDDCTEFSGLMVDQYVKVVCEEVKKIDSHHLNLGMRYAWISSELCYRAGAYFDVFSINGYTYPGPPETSEIARRSGKPVIIGEYHFGAVDRGLPASGIQAAEDQQARGEAYRYYLEQGFARPEIIGIHYFQWFDQPVFGRFDGENYNIGFLDICSRPYNELVDQAKQSHEIMYKVASGQEKPYDKVIKKTPQVFY
jgi:hypothetical protein